MWLKKKKKKQLGFLLIHPAPITQNLHFNWHFIWMLIWMFLICFILVRFFWFSLQFCFVFLFLKIFLLSITSHACGTFAGYEELRVSYKWRHIQMKALIVEWNILVDWLSARLLTQTYLSLARCCGYVMVHTLSGRKEQIHILFYSEDFVASCCVWSLLVFFLEKKKRNQKMGANIPGC